MKQSIGLVVLQIIGIILGFFSVFFVAGDLPPSVYAVLGIYSVISSIILVFSNTGIETYAIRNVLNWQEKGEIALIKRTVTQAILYRTFLSVIVAFLLIPYCFYVSKYKFHDTYLGLFIFMSFASIFRGINDSVILLLKAFNRYLASAFLTYSLNVFGKIIALFFFIYFGFNTYVIFIVILPLILTLPVLFRIKNYIVFDQIFSFEYFFESVKKNKAFSLSSYISFIFNHLDQMIVSIFMKNEFIGSFTLAKNFVNIGKLFIENIFDPMVQGLVKFKGNIQLIQKKLRFIFFVKNVLLLFSVIGFPFFVFYLSNIIQLFNLTDYLYLEYFLIFIYLSQIAHIAMKIKYNYIALFYLPKYYFMLTFIYASLNFIPLIIILMFQVKYVFGTLLIANFLMIFITNQLFKSEKIKLGL